MLDRADETRLRSKHLFSYLDVFFFLICSCFKASGPNCFLTFSLEIYHQKHFLTAKLKKKLRKQLDQTDRNVAKSCSLPS